MAAVTEADVLAAMAAEGFGGPLVAEFIEEVWAVALDVRMAASRWPANRPLGEPLPAYDPADIPFAASHVDALAWGCIGRAAFRAGEYNAAVYAESVYRARLADAVRTYAFDRVSEADG